MGDRPGGGEVADLTPALSHSTSFAEPNPVGIGRENWAAAESAARGIIRKVRPTCVSEERRREVVDYIQRLIRNRLSVEVFPYGSVPLKTYLPDGDIDLTAFGGASVEDALADDIRYVLEQEEKNMTSDFVVKDVQLIRAEVKLVKCIVQDIVVDVSFNQIGGLCTLCFLEQVDHLIGEDHLFKRSIILIKAWCYYESRILGAHHGLISTYALETLVLYIFQHFHSTLDGPLVVLYKFLDYFSKFDWETYCVSLKGPIRLSSLPDIVVDMPEDSDRNLLLSNDFLSSCVGLFSFPPRGGDKNSRGFQRKHLNIVDPLKEINNLGRSVSKGSFYRIRSAFSYGATKLAQILSQPENSIVIELRKFFANTMARHGGEQRPDVPDNSYEFVEDAVSSGDFQSISGKLSQELLKWPERSLPDRAANSEQYESSMLEHSTILLNRYHPSKPNTDTNELTIIGFEGLKISPDSSTFGTPLLKKSASAVDVPYHAPQLNSACSISCNGSIQDGSPDSGKLDKYEKGASSLALPGSDGERVDSIGSLDKKQVVDGAEVVDSSKDKGVALAQKTQSFSVDRTLTDLEQDSSDRNESSESVRASDLTGDCARFLHWLQYGKWCYEYGLSMHSLTTPPLPPTMWEGLLPPSHFEQSGFSNCHYNGFHPSQPVYVLQPVLLPGAFRFEDVAKPRGTGTYFPYMAQPPRGYRSSSMKGRNQTPLRSPRDNGRNMIFPEPNMVDRSSHESSQPQVPIDRSVIARISNQPTPSPRGNGFPKTSSSSTQPEGVIEFELVGQSSGSSMLEKSRQERSASSSPKNLSGVHMSQLALSRDHDRQ